MIFFFFRLWNHTYLFWLVNLFLKAWKRVKKKKRTYVRIFVDKWVAFHLQTAHTILCGNSHYYDYEIYELWHAEDECMLNAHEYVIGISGQLFIRFSSLSDGKWKFRVHILFRFFFFMGKVTVNMSSSSSTSSS